MTERKIISESVITLRKLIEIKRRSLLDKPKEADFKVWLGGREYPLDWMKKQFGETLKEKDGFIHPNGDRVDDADCNVCGRVVKPDEMVVHFNFSFCEEYGCGMNICSKCLTRLKSKLKAKVKP